MIMAVEKKCSKNVPKQDVSQKYCMRKLTQKYGAYYKECYKKMQLLEALNTDAK